MLNREIQTGLTLANERHPPMPRRGIGYQARRYHSLPDLRLLIPFPSIRMRKHKVYIVLNGEPEILAVGVGIFDVGCGAVEEVFEEVGDDGEHGFAVWERWDFGGDVCGGGCAIRGFPGCCEATCGG